MTLPNLLIDKRIVQRNLEQGKLEPAEYQRILDGLPDLSDKVWRRPAPQEPVVAETPTAEAAGVVQTPPAREAEGVEAEAAIEAAAGEAEAPIKDAEVASDPANSPRQDTTPTFDASL